MQFYAPPLLIMFNVLESFIETTNPVNQFSWGPYHLNRMCNDINICIVLLKTVVFNIWNILSCNRAVTDFDYGLIRQAILI